MINKTLITGAEGFIGKNLKSKLEKLYRVSVINEDIFNRKDWIVFLLDELDKINPDVIFHVGACSNTLEKDTNYMMKVNFEFSKHLSDWSKKNGKKLIYSSSAANYGENKTYPSNLYGWSKYTAEQYINSNGGISLRYFNVYGPGEEKKGKMSSIAFQAFEHKIKNKGKFKLFPNEPKRDFVFIDDVINANIHAMENYENLLGNFYEVGFGEARTFEDVLGIIGCEYDYLDKNMIPDGYQFFTCSNKNKWLKDWEPRFNLEKGLELYEKYNSSL